MQLWRRKGRRKEVLPIYMFYLILFEDVSSIMRWSEDEVSEDSGDGEDYVAAASKKLKTSSSPLVPPRSQATWSKRARPPTSKGIVCSYVCLCDKPCPLIKTHFTHICSILFYLKVSTRS